MLDEVTLMATLVALTNPVGSAAIFVSMTQGVSDKDLIALAKKTTISVFIVLLFSGICGPSILAFLGISMNAFTFGGGLILMSVGFSMFQGEAGKSNYNPKEHAESIGNLAVCPLTIPLIAGPGSMVAVIHFVHKMTFGAMNLTKLVVVLLAISLLCGGCLYATTMNMVHKIMRRKSVIGVVTRICGLIIIAIASDMILTSVAEILK
ncbi:MAG: MarC family protein [Pseudomonadota bacterium]|nr:MarC family protein [Pseudomonadota bacterium]